MWLTPDTLRNGAASGHYYENYVVMELVKNYAYAKSRVNISYFRDSNCKRYCSVVKIDNQTVPFLLYILFVIQTSLLSRLT